MIVLSHHSITFKTGLFNKLNRKLGEADGPWKRFSVLEPSYMSSPDHLSQSSHTSDITSNTENKLNEAEYELDVEDATEQRQKRGNLMLHFDYIPASKDEILRMLHMREKDVIDTLNGKINSFNSEAQHKDIRYFTFKDNALISAMNNPLQTTGTKILFRNMTGKFTWELSYIQALNRASFESRTTAFSEISENTLKIPFGTLLPELTSRKPSNENEPPSPLLTFTRKESHEEALFQKDLFNESFNYIKEHVTDFIEVINTRLTIFYFLIVQH